MELPGAKHLLGSEASKAFCASRSRDGLWKRGVLRLDGVVFADGECIGENRLGLWDELCEEREIMRAAGVLAQAARRSHDRTAVEKVREYIKTDRSSSLVRPEQRIQRIHRVRALLDWMTRVGNGRGERVLIDLMTSWANVPEVRRLQPAGARVSGLDPRQPPRSFEGSSSPPPNN